MKKKILSLLFFTCLSIQCLLAQERTISGKVLSADDNSGLPGVNVLLKGTTSGTTTDLEGAYQITVPPQGGILVFSYIGFATQEIDIGNRTAIEVKLADDSKQLQEVVVTAIGIERDKKAVGYAVSTVESAKLVQKSEADPIRALTGKVAGVNIQGSGGAVGGNTNITIRGNSSLTQSTQPLFVVDGVPFDNSINASGNIDGGNQYTNRAFDIDPNNIASMTVLKGAAAAALYGSRAANGVIVITTKSGTKGTKKGLEVTYNSSYAVEQVSGLPQYHDTWGSGQHQSLVTGFNGSMGPRYDEFDSVAHIYDQVHLNNSFPEYKGQKMAYRAYPNQAKQFLQNGHLTENALQISAGTGKASISGGISRMDNSGIVPNSKVSRTSVNMGGIATLDNGLFFNGSINYVNTIQATPQIAPSLGGRSSIFERLLFVPTMYDLANLPFEDPITGANVYNRTDVDNPYWVAKYTQYTSDVNRVFGKAQIGYDIKDWLTVTYQIGYNAYTDRRKDAIQKGSYDTPLGRISLDNIYREELDGNLLISVSRDLSPQLALRAIVGHNVNQRTTKRNEVEGNGIIVFNNYNFSNTASQRVLQDQLFKQRYQGIFGDFQFAYKDIYFLNLVARNDWSSTLPAKNRSYFYPGVSGSVILTEALPIQSAMLNYLKVRAGYTRVGNEAEPYRTSTVFNTNPTLNQTAFPFTTGGIVYNGLSVSNNSGTPDLKPEFITELELGADIKLLNNRVNIDFTYYDKRTTNSIAAIRLAPTSGFTQKLTNIGELSNRGIEVGLDITPVALENGFTWNVYTAFTRNRNRVESLQGLDQVVVGGRAATNILVVQRPGYAFGQLLGTVAKRDDEGNLLIGNNQLGRPLVADNMEIIGDPNPDYIVGVTNNLSFKGFNLSVLIDYKHGGDMWSQTASELLGRGVLAGPANGDREAARVVPGVLANTEGTGPLLVDGQKVRNNIPIAHYDWWFTQSFGVTNIREFHVFDASVVRVREVSLGYAFPKTLLSKTPFGSARLSVSGRNLWYRAPNFPKELNFDPETSAGSGSSAQGLDFIGVPTTRRFGANLSVTF
jgi:TonB-linked SusC/RagA family outer membrane protein